MEEYVSNSKKAKQETGQEDEHRVGQIVTSPVKSRKKSGIRKLSELILQEDTSNVKTYIIMDVLIPAAKKAFLDSVYDGIKMLLYGTAGGSRKSDDYGGRASQVSYRSYYNERREEPRRTFSTRSNYDFDDIWIPNRREAEEVLYRMNELIEVYGLVRVADFYDLVGVTGNYTDNKYGWTDIRTARVVHERDGYLIRLPRPLPLD